MGAEYPSATPAQIEQIDGRVILTRAVERFPFFRVEAGATGTVVEIGVGYVAVKMDEIVPGASEWDNEIVWSLDDAANADLDDAIAAFLEDARPLEDDHDLDAPVASVRAAWDRLER